MAFGCVPNAPRPLAADPWLKPYLPVLRRRAHRAQALERRLTGGHTSLADFASGHEYFGLHRDGGGWVFREWAPHAREVILLCQGTAWEPRADMHLRPLTHGQWEGRFPAECFSHGSLYRLQMRWDGGQGDRIPAYARRVVQDSRTGIFNAQVWEPAPPYTWRHGPPPRPGTPLIYECHVGMAIEETRVGTYREFEAQMLHRIRQAGYNTIQLMAVLEHPYYASFGYHVSSYFAPSSRFGTPDELKSLIDSAHGLGLRVIIDLVHSHAVRNETEGLARFDGTPSQFFHAGPRGEHPAWGSCCFDYGKPGVLHFLLSNCRYWLDEFRVDGFRFDGVTSMLYHHHGLGKAFTDYQDYFGDQVDDEALAYLALANTVVHAVRPDALTIAEDVSGMPGLAAPRSEDGIGFDCRLSMGVTDMWFKLLDLPDESWPLGLLWKELTNRRQDERTIGYVECHDQAIVGGQTLIFRLVREAMYDAMHVGSSSLTVDRGMALHRMIRLATLATVDYGYLSFMGNEFGHPEWIDFPREGNQWSLHHARRLWSLRHDPALRYRYLGDFDAAMLALVHETDLIGRARPQALLCSDADRVIAFERAGLFLVFNLDPNRSFAHYPLTTLPGEYTHVLDTDESRFGGFGRIEAGSRYPTHACHEAGTLHHRLILYLPARTALVLRRTPPARFEV